MSSANSSRSISRIPITVELVNKGNIDCEMIRHLAPVTVSKILKGLPIQDRIHRFKDQFIYIQTGLEIGAEKPKTKFKLGDVGFMTSNGAVCFFLKDSTVSAMSHVGILKEGIKLIGSARPGDVIVMRSMP